MCARALAGTLSPPCWHTCVRECVTCLTAFLTALPYARPRTSTGGPLCKPAPGPQPHSSAPHQPQPQWTGRFVIATLSRDERTHAPGNGLRSPALGRALIDCSTPPRGNTTIINRPDNRCFMDGHKHGSNSFH